MGSSDLEPQALRGLLSELLRSDTDFDAFCVDHFPDVQRRFASGMERGQKENLLLIHAPTRADIVAALRARFPDAAIVHERASPRMTWAKRKLPLLLSGIAGAVIVALVLWRAAPRPSPQRSGTEVGARTLASSECGALLVDDVFVVKSGSSPLLQQLMLDVRLRHGGGSAAPINLTRAAVQCGDKTPERSPYEPSASYDLLISGEQNEAALAQRLGTGEVDRILIRLGYTPEAAGYQYTARLKLLYNGGCVAESAPFTLSRDAARYVGFTR